MQHFIHGRKQKITKERVGMKWNFLKNCKKTLSKTATSQDQQWPAINSSAERIRNDIGNQIREGTSRPFAGTGKPIEALYGAARMNAVVANIGGGSKATGGGGMVQGMDLLLKYTQADTVVRMEDRVKVLNRKSKKQN